MAQQQEKTTIDTSSATFGSNAIRLSVRDWIAAIALVLAAVTVSPLIWKRLVPFDPPPHYRVPYALSEDYWTYDRWMSKSSAMERIVVVGDSVIWGEYVVPAHALPALLSDNHDHHDFANGGVNGAHPLALEGLLRCYGNALSRQSVVLHCNLLWMSSPERDLRVNREFVFNHPALVPQFWPQIPSYRATVADRLGVVIDRHVPLRSLVRHVRIQSFDQQDLPTWTLEHPYSNPFGAINLQIEQARNEPHSAPIAWPERGMRPQDIPWIDLDASLQWNAFQRTVRLLRARRSRVFVIVGPFNEHMLTPASRDRYSSLKAQALQWLGREQVPVLDAALLPSDEYGDASHPLRQGYARLAGELAKAELFQRWLRGE